MTRLLKFFQENRKGNITDVQVAAFTCDNIAVTCSGYWKVCNGWKNKGEFLEWVNSDRAND